MWSSVDLLTVSRARPSKARTRQQYQHLTVCQKVRQSVGPTRDQASAERVERVGTKACQLYAISDTVRQWKRINEILLRERHDRKRIKALQSME